MSIGKCVWCDKVLHGRFVTENDKAYAGMFCNADCEADWHNHHNLLHKGEFSEPETEVE